MANEIELKGQAAQLAVEVKSVIGDTGLSASEKGAKLEKIQAESERIGAELKNVATSKALLAQFEGTASHESPEVHASNDFEQKSLEMRAEYERNQVISKSRNGRVSHAFEVGVKAQGATNMMGEGATGTAVPTGSNQNYFLAGNAGPAILPNFLPGIVDLRFYGLTIASLFASGSTDSPIISYLQETSWTNNSAATAEGATKPYSTNTIGRVQEQVGKITNMHKLTDEMFQDASQYVSFLNNRLVTGVQRQEEVQVLAGNGYPGVNGLLNRTTSFTVGSVIAPVTGVVVPTAATPGEGSASAAALSLTPGYVIHTTTGVVAPATAATAIADGLFQVLTDLRTKAFIQPDAIVMNPAQWQVLRLAKDGQGQYLGGSFFGYDYGNGQASPQETLWGLKVVVTPAIPVGYAVVGGFNECGQLFRKQGIVVESSNSNGTDFEQNLVSVRAESRLGLAIYRPAGFSLVQILTP